MEQYCLISLNTLTHSELLIRPVFLAFHSSEQSSEEDERKHERKSKKPKSDMESESEEDEDSESDSSQSESEESESEAEVKKKKKVVEGYCVDIKQPGYVEKIWYARPRYESLGSFRLPAGS